jgi:hypothetical protein
VLAAVIFLRSKEARSRFSPTPQPDVEVGRPPRAHLDDVTSTTEG